MNSYPVPDSLNPRDSGEATKMQRIKRQNYAAKLVKGKKKGKKKHRTSQLRSEHKTSWFKLPKKAVLEEFPQKIKEQKTKNILKKREVH